MTDEKTAAEVAVFDTMLADPADRERLLARQNMLAQQELMKRMGMNPPRPPKPTGNGHPN